jgi:hypothetical protein
MRGLIRPHLRRGGPVVAGARSPPGEAFIPDGSPYLGQTILGEPLRQSNVLSRTGDCRDETSIGCDHV